MKQVKIITTIILISCFALFAGHKLPEESPDPDAPYRQEAESILSEGMKLVKSGHSNCLYEAIDHSGKVVWHLCFSHLSKFRKRGYADFIDILAAIDEEGKIARVVILKHNETPSFTRRMEEPAFLNQFEGKTASSPITPGIDIDGITHATITTEALCNEIRNCVSEFQGKPLPSDPRFSGTTQTGIIMLIAVISIALLRKKLPTWLPGLSAALLLGFYSRQFLSLSHLQLFHGSLSPPLYFTVFMTVSFISAIFIPRGYCRHICPMGGLQDFLTRILAQTKKSRTADGSAEISSKTDFRPPFDTGRSIFIAALALMIIEPKFPAETLEVFPHLFLLKTSYWGGLLVFSALAGSSLAGRFYCRRLCPLNPLFQDLESIKSSLSKGRKHEPPAIPS